MSAEATFIAALRALPTDPAARALLDDVAVLEVGGTKLVLTHDAIAEGVHYRADDPPGDVAWKLVAVNLSDLAAKGAKPIGALLGFALGSPDWDRAFVAGLGRALAAFAFPLLGGDTVAGAGAPRTLSLTAIGEATGPVPSRAGAAAGDDLWVSGTIGDAGAGLAILQGSLRGDDALVRRYRAPRPRLKAGQALVSFVSAMMDISDGLLIDAGRLGHASSLGVSIDLDQVPLSQAFLAALGGAREQRLRAATAGDDYELLFTAHAEHRHRVVALAEQLGLPLTRIGRLEPGAGLTLVGATGSIPLPERLGWEHERR